MKMSKMFGMGAVAAAGVALLSSTALGAEGGAAAGEGALAAASAAVSGKGGYGIGMGLAVIGAGSGAIRGLQRLISRKASNHSGDRWFANRAGARRFVEVGA